MNDTYQTLLVASIALVTVVGVAALPIAAQESPTETPETPTEDGVTPTENETETEAADGEGDQANVTFANTTSNGSAVTVESATVPDGGFVLIYTLNESAVDGGAANQTTETTVAEATPDAEGEDGAGVTPGEETTTDEDGAAATPGEETTTAEDGADLTPDEEGEDTPAGEETAGAEDGADVTPGEDGAGTAADGAAITAIDNVTLATLGSQVGASSHLDSGTHENVTVEYGGEMVEDQVLIAVVYQDINDNSTYDGLEMEAPYLTDDDEIVGDWAYVTLEEDGTAEDETPEDEAGAGEEPGEGEETTPAEDGEATPAEDGDATPADDGAGVTPGEAGEETTPEDGAVGEETDTVTAEATETPPL